MNVLLVDDDRIGLELLARQLAEWGYQVTTAKDGREAWHKFREHDFSVVISDWLMPGVDGLELLGRIRAAETAHTCIASC
jgi:sigma-B regulation protein RsbU (phosphoserine phosphatase)